MAALVKERAGSIRTIKRAKRPLDAAVKSIKGGLAVLDTTSGYDKPGITETDSVTVGRFTETVDNSGGLGGAKEAEIDFLKERVVMLMRNDSVDPVAITDREQDCYTVDDQTVAGTDGTGTRSVCGKVYDVTSEGVWVEIR